MIKNFKSKEFILFLMAGGFAAVVNFGSRFFYNYYTSFGNAVVLAYITGMIIAFVLSKLFVFNKSMHSTQKEFFYFILVNLVALVQTYLISIVLGEYLFPRFEFFFYPDAVAHAIGIMFPAFSSYLGHKYFTFKVNDVSSKE